MPTHYLCLPKKITRLRPWTLKSTLSSISPLCVTSHKKRKEKRLSHISHIFVISYKVHPLYHNEANEIANSCTQIL